MELLLEKLFPVLVYLQLLHTELKNTLLEEWAFWCDGCFGFMILILATFVSHTVAALIILPLIKSVGERMDDPHPRLLVMGAAFLCSAAMGLPTSGFPNVTAICMTDEFNRPYLTVGNFISRGVPSSFWRMP